ncbi:MAG: formate dehydrogenase subunit gamma [Acetobacteraceae bacterium]|nr:formate dehydrogenase subunit gamma [Acetobacteraceae bacterium]
MRPPPGTVLRYPPFSRFNHWVTAVCMVLLVMSGLAFFYPWLYWLTVFFGGGQMARATHPWIGVVLFISYAIMVVRFFRHNLPHRDDLRWLRALGHVASGREELVPEVGRYNPGQKFVYWANAFLILILLVTGIIIWDWYFYNWTTIEQKRVAVLIHSIAAFFTILVLILHVYSAIWVRGTMPAMTRGYVPVGWVYRHHRKWLRQEAELAAQGKPSAIAGAPAVRTDPR